MKRIINAYIIGLLTLFLLSNCDKNKDDNKSKGIIKSNESQSSNSLIGLWVIKTEQYLDIRGNDTVDNYINQSGDCFELKNDSVLIVYWHYPDSFDRSIWFKKGNDSLYMYFDGPDSKVISKYKFKQIDNSRMIWERTHNEWEGVVQKSIFEIERK